MSSNSPTLAWLKRFVLAHLIYSIALAMLLLIWPSAVGSAAVPYKSFTYNFWRQEVPSPQAYVPVTVVRAASFGVGDLKSPLDLAVDSEDNIYLLDTGNNRILRMDSDLKLTQVIDQFENNGTVDRFSRPSGLFLTDSGHIYVADTGNSRIVELDQTGTLVRIIGAPDTEAEGAVQEGFVYMPTKVGVDPTGKMYVVASGVYDGLISLDAQGEFTGFIGAPRVTPSAADLFWSRISTRQQRERRALFLPISYSNLDIDDIGFVYATVSTARRLDGDDEAPASTEDLIKRLNPAGLDTLRRNGFVPPRGNLDLGSPSRFVDIAARSFGGYSALDIENRIVYTYDDDGNLLYTFGGKGTQAGTLLEPVAIDVLSDQRVLVLDKGRNELTVYSPTPYATTIHLAMLSYRQGRYDEATQLWRRTLIVNPNYDLAYRGIARAMLMSGRYEEAMRYAELGYDRKDYSKAFRYLRERLIEQYLGTAILIAGAVGMAAYALNRAVRRHLRQRRASRSQAQADSQLRLPDRLKFALHVAIHPIDGFWRLKHERRGNVLSATIVLLMACISYLFLRQYTGFLFNYRDLNRMNIYREMASVLVPFVLWTTVSWAMTTLMDGKGTLKDIYIATAYALTPMVLLMVPAVLFSRCLSLEEGGLYSFLVTLSVGWSLLLVFLGAMVIHDYDLQKCAITSGCTICGMGIAIFIVLLFSSIFAQFMGFATDVYYEIVFRL